MRLLQPAVQHHHACTARPHRRHPQVMARSGGQLRAATPARSTRRPAAPPFLHPGASPRPFTAAAIARHGFLLASQRHLSPRQARRHPYLTTAIPHPARARMVSRSRREPQLLALLTISYRVPNRFCTSYSGHQAAATASNLQRSSPPPRAAMRPSASPGTPALLTGHEKSDRRISES